MIMSIGTLKPQLLVLLACKLAREATVEKTMHMRLLAKRKGKQKGCYSLFLSKTEKVSLQKLPLLGKGWKTLALGLPLMV